MDVVNEKTVRKILPYVKSIENGTIRGPISLHLLITDNCVNKCNMCGHWKTEDKKSLSIDTIKKIWNSMNENDGESICLTGGDPIIHSSFDEILSLERNFDLGIICTGNFKRNFDFAKLQKLRWLRFSIDSLNPSRYNRIRGVNNLYGTIIPNLKKAQEYVEQVGINFTIQHLNTIDIKDIVDFSINNNIYRLMLYPMHGDSNISMTIDDIKFAVDKLADIISIGSYKEIPENNIEFLYESLKESLEKGDDVRKTAFDYSKYPCIINKIHLAIGSDGSVFPCEMIADDTDAYGERTFWEANSSNIFDTQFPHKMLGNVNDEDLIEIWRNNFNKSFCSGKCSNCFSRYLPINQAYHENSGKKVFI